MVERIFKFFSNARKALPWIRGRPRVQTSGLADGPFKESVEEECERALERFEKKLGGIEGIAVHAKVNDIGSGGRKLFELQGTLFLTGGHLGAGGQLFSKASDPDIFTALKCLLDGFDKEVQHAQSFKQEKYVSRRLKRKASLWKEE